MEYCYCISKNQPSDEDECSPHQKKSCGCANSAWLKHFFKDGVHKDEPVKIFDAKRASRDGKQAKPESVMYTGCTIRPLTNGNANETVEAIAFHDGKVCAVGNAVDVKKKLDDASDGKYTEMKIGNPDFTLLPGLIDPHVHILVGAVVHMKYPKGDKLIWNDFSPFNGQELRQSNDEYTPKMLEQKLQEVYSGFTKDELDKSYWILGRGLDPALMPYEVRKNELNVVKTFPPHKIDEMESKEMLDSGVCVLILSASGHTAYVNKAAVNKIYDNISNDKEKYPDFNMSRDDYMKHVTEQNGLQELDDLTAGFGAIPDEQLEAMKDKGKLYEALDFVIRQANQRGVTFLYDAAMEENMYEFLKGYFSQDESPSIRISFAELCKAKGPDEVKLHTPTKPTDKFEQLYQTSVKLLTDGSNQGLTGSQIKEYCCEPEGNHGTFNYKSDNFCKILKKIQETSDLQIVTHANGDDAIDIVCKAYKDILKDEVKEKRHRIEHFSVPSEDNVKAVGDLEGCVSFTIGHVGYWGRVFENAIFEEKARKRLLPCRSALDHNICITLNSDYPVTPLGPLRMMEQAVTRVMEEDPPKGQDQGNVLNPDQKITPAEALRAVTYDAAWQCYADKWVGELKPGKMADYVILHADPVKMETEEDAYKKMRYIQVKETWVGGYPVFFR